MGGSLRGGGTKIIIIIIIIIIIESFIYGKLRYKTCIILVFVSFDCANHQSFVLKSQAIEAIQAIVIHYRKKDFNFEEFPEVLSSKMSNLRLMIIDKTDYLYDQGHLAVPNDQRQLFVPNQLRHLSWNCCPLKCLSSSSQPKELVQLDLQYSRIEYLWEGVMVILFFLTAFLLLFIISFFFLFFFFKCSYKY